MSTTFTTVVRFAMLDRWDPPHAADTAAYAWPLVTLGEIAQVRLGVQVPRRGSSPTGEARPYLRAANVRRGWVDTTDVKTMRVPATQAAALELRAGDLLFLEGSGSISEVGRVALWDGRSAGVIHQNSVVRARLQDARLDPAYVVTWFNSHAGNRYIRAQATTTSGLFHIGAGKLARAPIPVPPLEIQKRVVANYEQGVRQARMDGGQAERAVAEAWTTFARQIVPGQASDGRRDLFRITRFAVLDRWDTRAAFSTLAGVLHPVVRLCDVAHVRLGTQVPARSARPTGTTSPYLRAANVQRGRLDLRDVKKMTVPSGTAERLRLQDGDVLFVEGNSREEVGRAARWPADQPGTIIQNSIIRARLTTDTLLPEYVTAWFNSPPGGQYARERATTTSGSLWHIGAGKLAAAPLPVPPLEEQRRLVEQLADALAAAESAARAAESLVAATEAELLVELVTHADPSGGVAPLPTVN